MAAVHRATRQGLLCLTSRLAAWQQQSSAPFSSLTAGLWAPEASTTVRQPASPSSLTRLTSLIPSLGDMAWLAVPKRKVTPHRKGKRSATKFIRFVPVVSQCGKCGRVFQQHQMPSKCEEEECPAFNLRARPE